MSANLLPIFLAERTMDCDGSGWAFRYTDVPADLVNRYIAFLKAYEGTISASVDAGKAGIRKVYDKTDIDCPDLDDRRIVSVLRDAANRSPKVQAAWSLVDSVRTRIVRHIVETEQAGGIDVSCADVCTADRFAQEYRPLIAAADEANGNTWHGDYFVKNGYTSIFNGR